MRTYDRLRELPLSVETIELELLQKPVSSGFTRVSTLVRLRGGGTAGIGEDVTYAAADQTAFHEHQRHLQLAGTFTLESLSNRLDEFELFPRPPEQETYRDYRRWAFESAALDLALQQAGQPLSAALGREPATLTFVVSLRLPNPPTTEPIRRLRARYPGIRFKVDPETAWTRGFMEELAAVACIDVIDLKGCYRGTIIDQQPDARLYRDAAEAFRTAWIEDPKLTPETDAALAPYRDRITWDAPIHSVADIESLPFPPRALNIKPSRFGTLDRLFDGYDWCAVHGVRCYGGGQFELGVGRGQIQYLASLLHPDSPNDVAPVGYNEEDPPDGLPQTPLAPAAGAVGFRWSA